jgi:hypothetical protein
VVNPIFEELPFKYHDRVRVNQDDVATVTVQDGSYTVPQINDTDRKSMGLPPSRHHDRTRDSDHPWYPPNT